ncbi:MAG: type IV pilus modification PilV family protein [Myxococcota bacterium]
MASSSRGFTLLEVLVAVAILGLGLTMILSSQVGLFSNASRVEHLTIATNLARCKMGEIEIELLKKGYPPSDMKDDGRCCGDDSDPGYECEWKIELVRLPDQNADAGAMDASLGPLGQLANLGSTLGGPTGSPGSNPLGALGGLAGPSGMGAGQGQSSLKGIAQNVSSTTSGIGPMVMGMVYPGLKPMLEASIRKVTLRVKWKEGIRERDVLITQYVTDPQKAGLNLDGGLGPNQGLGVGGGTGTGMPPAQTLPGTGSPFNTGFGR